MYQHSVFPSCQLIWHSLSTEWNWRMMTGSGWDLRGRQLRSPNWLLASQMVQSCVAARASTWWKANPMGAPKLHVKMFYCWFSFWMLIEEVAVHKKLLSPRLKSGACYTRFSVSRSLTAIWEKMRKTTNQEICFPKTFQSNWALTPSDGLLLARH